MVPVTSWHLCRYLFLRRESVTGEPPSRFRQWRQNLTGVIHGYLQLLEQFHLCTQMASGIHFSLLASFVFGTPEFPVSEVPLQQIVDRVAKGIYKTKPAAVFSFEEIREAQRLMESNTANGKIIVKL